MLAVALVFVLFDKISLMIEESSLVPPCVKVIEFAVVGEVNETIGISEPIERERERERELY